MVTLVGNVLMLNVGHSAFAAMITTAVGIPSPLWEGGCSVHYSLFTMRQLSTTLTAEDTGAHDSARGREDEHGPETEHCCKGTEEHCRGNTARQAAQAEIIDCDRGTVVCCYIRMNCMC